MNYRLALRQYLSEGGRQGIRAAGDKRLRPVPWFA